MLGQQEVLKVIPKDGTPMRYKDIVSKMYDRKFIPKKPYGSVGNFLTALVNKGVLEKDNRGYRLANPNKGDSGGA